MGDIVPFCVAGAVLREPGAAFGQGSLRDHIFIFIYLVGIVFGKLDTSCVWQIQHLGSLGAASGQLCLRDGAPFCMEGISLMRLMVICVAGTPLGAGYLLLRGRCSI